MPRDSQGTFSLVPGTLVNSGDTIVVSQHNPPFQDVATGLTNSLDRNGSGGMRAPLNMNSYPIQNLAPGTNANDAVTVSQAAGIGVPIGASVDFWGVNVPVGWLEMIGQTVNTADWPLLAAALGVASSTFMLPDTRGRTTAGIDTDNGSGFAGRLTNNIVLPDGRTMRAVGGSQTYALEIGQMPQHSHTGTTASDGAHTHSVTLPRGDNSFPNGGGNTLWGNLLNRVFSTSSSGAHTHSFTTDTRGSGSPHPNVQPTIICRKIIKAGNN